MTLNNTSLFVIRKLVLCFTLVFLTISCSDEEVKKEVILLKSISVSAPGFNAGYFYSYDDQNRITYIKEVTGGSITFETFYTYQDSKATMTNSDGIIFTMTFDDDGKLIKGEQLFNDEVVSAFTPEYTDDRITQITYANESFTRFNYDEEGLNVTSINTSSGWSISYEYTDEGLNPWNLLLQANPHNLILWSSAANPNDLFSKNSVASAGNGALYDITFDKRNLPVISQNYFNGNQSGTLYFTYEVR